MFYSSCSDTVLSDFAPLFDKGVCSEAKAIQVLKSSAMYDERSVQTALYI